MGCHNSRNYLKLKIQLDQSYFIQSEIIQRIPLNTTSSGLVEFIKNTYLQQRFDKDQFQIYLFYKEQRLKTNLPFHEYFAEIVQQSKIDPINIQSETYYLGRSININISLQSSNQKKELSLALRQNEKILKLAKEIKNSLKSEMSPRLFLKNQELELEYTLQNYDITETCNVKAFFNLKKYDKLNWQTLKTGLVIQSICDYPECQAFQQKVYLNKGFGSFNIAKTYGEAQCPCCLQQFQNTRLVNFGFINCQYWIQRDKIYQNHRTETFDKQKYKIAQGLHILKQKSLQAYLEKKYKIEVRKLVIQNNQSFLVPDIVNQCSAHTENSTEYYANQTPGSNVDWRSVNLFKSTDTAEKFKDNTDSISKQIDSNRKFNFDQIKQ